MTLVVGEDLLVSRADIRRPQRFAIRTMCPREREKKEKNKNKKNIMNESIAGTTRVVNGAGARIVPWKQ